MKSFTVRDLDRTPAKVLAAVDRDGVARIQSRDGRLYVMSREKAKSKKETHWAAFAQHRARQLRTIFPDGPVISANEARSFDDLLASNGTLL